ncbi:tetratricopeptide repeat protein [Candidatus Peregrinibacteria bacterium]|nr:tetratricopeptide repeat protein [Candidatus Peregrinibacteria bacterium]
MRSLLRRADKAEAQKKYDEAEKLYIQALTIFPDAFEAQAQLARLYLQTNRESKAVAIYQQLIQEHDNVSYYSNLGLAHFRLGQFTEACDFYNRALLKDPSSPDRCSALGRAYIAADKIEKAIPLLKKAVERMPRDTELLSDLASCYLHCGDSANARIIYSQINKLEPYNESVKQKLKELRIKES